MNLNKLYYYNTLFGARRYFIGFGRTLKYNTTHIHVIRRDDGAV